MNPSSLVHRATLGLCSAALVALFALPASAVPLTISDGTATVTVDDQHGGALDFILGGTDHLFQASYYYRTDSMSQEGRMTGFGSAIVSSVLADDIADTITVTGGTGEFSFNLVYRLNGSGLLVPTLVVTNLDSVNPLNLTLFAYHDWDVNGSANGDSVSWDGTEISQSQGATDLRIRPFQTPDAVEAGAFNPPGPTPSIRDELRDGNVDNLTDDAGLPFGPGDGIFAFQFDLTLAEGGSSTLIYAVPEPSTGALAALGLIGLAWIGRDRNAQR